MSLQEQAETIASSDITIDHHGAGLTNLIYAKPGSRVLELFTRNYINVCYWTLSNQLGLDYYYLIGESTNPMDYPARQNFTVNLQEIEGFLSKTISNRHPKSI
jgi:capsular polysaccharide biosynthesis protein